MPVDPKDPVGSEMRRFKAGKLHSGSPHGPIIHSRAQALAAALNVGRKAGKVPPKPSGEPDEDDQGPGMPMHGGRKI